jgi:hypothetical protein
VPPTDFAAHSRRFPRLRRAPAQPLKQGSSVDIKVIEVFWSFTKHILYNYWRVSKYHFSMYLKEVE